MRWTVLVAAVCTIGSVVGPIDGTVHGDGQIRWTRTVTAGLAVAGDPIHQTLNLEAQYWRCSNQLPPRCWEVGAIKFYSITDLGYRRHTFNGKTAVIRGALGWSEYTGKTFRVSCHRADNTVCADDVNVPHGRTWAKVKRRMTPSTFPSPNGFFRYVATVCVLDTCSAASAKSFPVNCVPRNEQCYFDVD